jgi:hypothetical protein
MSHFRGSLHYAVGYVLSPAPQADFINELLIQDTGVALPQLVAQRSGVYVMLSAAKHLQLFEGTRGKQILRAE